MGLMKNTITISLVVLSAFGFAACSSDSGSRAVTGEALQNFSGPADGSTIGANLYNADWSLHHEMTEIASQNFSAPADGSTIGTNLYPGMQLS